MVKEEELLEAWVGMTSLFKNSRLTKGLTYNEATILMYLYHAEMKGFHGLSAGEILQKSKMQKSLLNRTLELLLKKGLITKEQGLEDKRTIFIKLVPEKMEKFQTVHQESLHKIEKIISIIGEDRAKAFIETYGLLSAAGDQVDFNLLTYGENRN